MQKNKVARRQVRAQNITLVEEREARRVRRSRRNMLIVCALCIALIGLIAAYYLTDYLDWARINNYPMKYEDVIDKYAAEYQLDPALVCAVIYTESKFDKDAVSVDGARGLMQIMPETNDSRKALAAYNAGQGNVDKWLTQPEYSSDGIKLDHIPFKETRNYVKKVKAAHDIYLELYYSNESEAA